MVVISAAILSKQGKTLVARQFVEISRPRIEGLLAAFPKLLGSDGTKKEHTFIETPSVRYVYQPMEDLYMLIITNKSSNILEDLDSLHLLAKIVGDYCERLQEDDVLHAAFDLIFAFDECFAMGYKEKLTMRQIEENLEMDSHNERIHEITLRNQQHDAELQAQEVAARLERERKAGIRSVSQLPSQQQTYTPVSAYSPAKPEREEESWERSASSGRSGGMKLSSSKKVSKDDAFLQQVAKQDKSVKSSVSTANSNIGNLGGAANDNVAERKSVDFELKEVVTATIDKEGEVASVGVKGELNLLISDPACAAIQVQLTPSDPHFSFHTHPAVDKQSFKKNVLAPKDPEGAPFPVHSKVKVATWKSKGNLVDELTPITINCWPSAGSQQTTVVNMEFELQHKDRVLRNLSVKIPIQSKTAPVVQRAFGDYKYDARAKVLEWNVPVVDEESCDGSIEFVIANLSHPSDLFPIEASFVGDYCICSIDPQQVASADGPVEFSKKAILTADNYHVVNEA